MRIKERRREPCVVHSGREYSIIEYEDGEVEYICSFSATGIGDVICPYTKGGCSAENALLHEERVLDFVEECLPFDLGVFRKGGFI